MSIMLTAIVLAAAGVSHVGAQEASGGKKGLMKDVNAAKEAVKRASTPGPEHERMKKMVGSWKVVTREFMGPGKPKVSEARAENTMILDGRFLRQEFHGVGDNADFEGLGISGFDRVREKYVDVWMDSKMTTISSLEGTWDPETKTLTSTGKMPSPAGGAYDLRSVTTERNDDEIFFEMYVKGDKDKEKKVMEMTYTRIR